MPAISPSVGKFSGTFCQLKSVTYEPMRSLVPFAVNKPLLTERENVWLRLVGRFSARKASMSVLLFKSKLHYGFAVILAQTMILIKTSLSKNRQTIVISKPCPWEQSKLIGWPAEKSSRMTMLINVPLPQWVFISARAHALSWHDSNSMGFTYNVTRPKAKQKALKFSHDQSWCECLFMNIRNNCCLKTSLNTNAKNLNNAL